LSLGGEGQAGGDAVLGSYESWAQTLGGILDAVGVEGSLDDIKDFYAEANDEAAIVNTFVEGWWRRFGTATQTPSRLLRVANEADFPIRSTD
jgi:putative DNA primase/helicase